MTASGGPTRLATPHDPLRCMHGDVAGSFAPVQFARVSVLRRGCTWVAARRERVPKRGRARLRSTRSSFDAIQMSTPRSSRTEHPAASPRFHPPRGSIDRETIRPWHESDAMRRVDQRAARSREATNTLPRHPRPRGGHAGRVQPTPSAVRRSARIADSRGLVASPSTRLPSVVCRARSARASRFSDIAPVERRCTNACRSDRAVRPLEEFIVDRSPRTRERICTREVEGCFDMALERVEKRVHAKREDPRVPEICATREQPLCSRRIGLSMYPSPAYAFAPSDSLGPGACIRTQYSVGRAERPGSRGTAPNAQCRRLRAGYGATASSGPRR